MTISDRYDEPFPSSEVPPSRALPPPTSSPARLSSTRDAVPLEGCACLYCGAWELVAYGAMHVVCRACDKVAIPEEVED